MIYEKIIRSIIFDHNLSRYQYDFNPTIDFLYKKGYIMLEKLGLRNSLIG